MRCAKEYSKRKTILINKVLSNKELDESIEHTSSVRYIDPVSGEYLDKKPEMTESMHDTNLARIIFNYKGNVAICRSISFQARRRGFKSLSQKQIDAFIAMVYRGNRSSPIQKNC
jgi:hypothetical protein